RIVRDKGFFKDEWRLGRAHLPPARSPAAESKLFERLFKNGFPLLLLKNTNASTVSGARSAHSSAIGDAMVPSYFKRNSGSIFKAFLVGAVPALLAFWLAGEFGKAVVVLIGVLMVITLIVFGLFSKAPPP